jgi:hypothetical protein
MRTMSAATAALAVGFVSSVFASVAGCSVEPTPSQPAVAEVKQAQTASPSAWSRSLRWGSGPAEVGFRPGAPELLAEGPSAVAVGPAGANGAGDQVYLLDRLNERVLVVGASETRVTAAVPADSEELAVGPDGALATLSPFRARAWVYGTDGGLIGELAVPRTFQRIHGIGLGPSRRVSLRTSYQESHDLGSPSAPTDLTAALRSKREGAFFLADGHGVVARHHEDGTSEIVILDPGPVDVTTNTRESTRVARRVDVGPGWSSVRLVGTVDDIACVRLEAVRSTPEIAVDRAARCFDTTTGALLLDEALPAPGVYVPRQELAFGGHPGRLVFLHPTDDGLTVTTWTLDAEVAQ